MSHHLWRVGLWALTLLLWGFYYIATPLMLENFGVKAFFVWGLFLTLPLGLMLSLSPLLELKCLKMTIGLYLVGAGLVWFAAPSLPGQWGASFLYLEAYISSMFGFKTYEVGLMEKIFICVAAGVFVMIGFGIALIKASPFWKVGFGEKDEREQHRAKSNVFGDARWGNWSHIKEEAMPLNTAGGIVIGEDYDPRVRNWRYNVKDRSTWGKGGKAPLIEMDLRYEDGHSLVFSGSGGGKTVAYVIPTVVHYGGAILVVDPDGEAITAGRSFREAMGRNVREISFTEGCSIDIFAIMKPFYEKDVMAFRDIASSMLMMQTKDSFNQFYFDPGVDLLSALLEYYCLEKEIHPLDGIAGILKLSTADIRKEYGEIASESQRDNIKAVLNQMATQGDDFFQWLQPTMKRSLNWMVHEDIRASLMTEPQDAPPPLDAKTDIFITIPYDRLADMGGYIKLVLGVFSYYLKNRETKDHRRLLMIDEAAAFGYVPLFETIRDTGRKHGIHLMLIFQSQLQLRECYGADAERAWAAVSLRAYSAVEDISEAKEISETVGSYTADVEGQSKSQRQSPFSLLPNSLDSSSQRSLQRAQLINPDEIRTLPSDAQILVFRRQHPIICGKALAFRRKEWEGYETKYHGKNATLD